MPKANQLKVVVDLTPLLPGGANGGVKPAIKEFLKALAERSQPRFRLSLITNSLTDQEAAGWFAPGEVETHCLDQPGQQGNLPVVFFRRSGFNVLYAPFGMARFPHAGVPTVAMVVDLLHRDYPASLPEQERQWREQYFSQMVIAVDRFQVISDYTGRQLERHYRVPTEKIFRTYLPIQDRFPGSGSPLANRGVNYFFYPANFWPHKNHEVLLIAYQIYLHSLGQAAWRLVLTGSDPERQQQLRLLSEALGISGHVDFLGHIPERELMAAFSQSSALVFPSLHEGFGIPPLEAMRFGVPVIASDSGSLGEVIGGAALRVDPRRPLALAEAMQALSRSPDLQQELREKGARRLLDFSFAGEISRLVSALTELGSQTNARTAPELLRRRFSLWRARQLNSGPALVKSAYRFIRDRV